ncbi:cytochrome c oxidase assembly factor 5 isoform X2 [Cephus cinctus]|uniref:Cytochrome c oxidase assembly factor 5 n=1 Tax=Cephus cinctus TaxID=211228 RepID=A0AAJ7BGG8_CEPCN|nr:cytochrome c oxidase assembly factor 5 isoform X2 [Cephus cinctus]
MIEYENENERLKDTSRCAGHKRTPRECLRITDGSVPEECQALRVSFFECKRSLLDGRRRFRGPKGY